MNGAKIWKNIHLELYVSNFKYYGFCIMQGNEDEYIIKRDIEVVKNLAKWCLCTAL